MHGSEAGASALQFPAKTVARSATQSSSVSTTCRAPAAKPAISLKHGSHQAPLRVMPIQERGPTYATYMTRVYESVSVAGRPNYQGARLQLPFNLQFEEWEALVSTEEDGQLIELLRYGFPMGYEGPVPTPAESNHASAQQHRHDVDACHYRARGGGNAGAV